MKWRPSPAGRRFARRPRRPVSAACWPCRCAPTSGLAGAVALYGDAPGVFRGAAHDIALLFAAQGGTAVRNASLYRACRRMVDDLQAALESRAVIEQAKGILQAELGISPAEAFRLLSRYSQNTNQRVRAIASRLVRGRITAAAFRQLGER